MKRNYPLLLLSQTLSAFGDQFVLAVIIGQLTFLKQKGAISEQYYQSSNAIYPSLLFIPYVLFGPLTGFLNDRFAKTRWLLGGNVIKFTGCLFAAASLAFGWPGLEWQGVGYFIIGLGACIYGPAKYGILPEILPTERLVKANGTVEMLTLLSILVGAVGGAKMIDAFKDAPLMCYGALLGIYGTALVLNACMTVTPHNENVRLRDSVGEFAGHFRSLLRHRRLGKVLLGTAVFWVCGSVMKMNFNPWGLETLGFKTEANPNTAIALLGLWLAVGIMIGSVLAGQFHRVGELHWTRRYGVILAATIAGLGLLAHRGTALGMLIAAGIFAGLFLIPLNAALQAESDPGKLGKTIACQNFLENVAMCLSGGLVLLATSLAPKDTVIAPKIFLGLAALVVISIALLKIPEKESGRSKLPTTP